MPVHGGGTTTHGQPSHRITVFLPPDIGQAFPEGFAAAAGAFDQQAGFHQFFIAVGFVGEGEGLGQYGAGGEVNTTVGIAAILAVPVHRLGAGGHEGYPVFGGVVGEQLGVQHEGYTAFVGQAAWIRGIGEQVVLFQAWAVYCQGVAIDFTAGHLSVTQFFYHFRRRRRIEIAAGLEGGNFHPWQ